MSHTNKLNIMCYNPKTFYFTRSHVASFHSFAQMRFENILHSRGDYVEERQIDCGKCEECLEKKRLNWTKRLVADFLSLKSQFFFVTLTYDSEHVPIIPVGKKFEKYQTKKRTYNIYTQHLTDVCTEIRLGSQREYISHKLKTGVFVPPQPNNKKWRYNPAKLRYQCHFEDFEPVPEAFQMVHSKYDVDKFLKRFRINAKRLGFDLTGKLKYCLVSEYGCAGERPHYHAIMYGFPQSMSRLAILDLMRVSWSFGFVKVDKPKISAIRYVCKYMYSKSVVPKGCPQNFRLFSAGIGSSFDPSQITCDDDITQMFVPMGKRGAFKFVSIPLQCLAYYYKKVVQCPLYESYKRKVNDVSLCVKGFGYCGNLSQNDAVRFLPVSCTSMLQALVTRHQREISPSYLYSTIDEQAHKLQDSQYNADNVKRAMKAFQTGCCVLPVELEKRCQMQLKQVRHLIDKCAITMQKQLYAKIREIKYLYKCLTFKYSYDRYWNYWLKSHDEWMQMHVVRPSRYELANTCPF